MICTEKLLSNNVRYMPVSKMTEFFNLPADVISLGLGEPGFVTPDSVCQGALDAIRSGLTSYPPSSGYPELREKTAGYLAERFGFLYAPDEVLITLGASLALDCIIRTFVDPGDEVLIPTPAYNYYITLTGLCGGRTVFVPTYRENAWALMAGDLKRALTPKTKLLILNYPNNPTGAVMTREHFAAIADVLRGTDVLVVTDEVYAECVFGERHASILEHEGMRERTLLVSGFSKSMAMTGWRIGYVCAPKELLQPVAAVNAAVTLCASSIAQAAAMRGLDDGQADVDRMAAEYRRRRDFITARAQELGWTFCEPGGAFYLWADVSSTGMDAESFTRALIRQAKVAVMPGTVFGSAYSSYARLTYSYPMDTLAEGMERIARFVRTGCR